MRQLTVGALLAVLVVSTGCASLGALGRLVQPPRCAEDGDRPAEIRLLGPGLDQPIGGATVRVWMRVTNPNPFGFRLTRLQTQLRLEGNQAATGDFPLGLPLGPSEESTVPLDLSISFADLPGLSRVIQRVSAGESVGYELAGTVGVDAGSLGQPTFGPMTFIDGDLVVSRRTGARSSAGGR